MRYSECYRREARECVRRAQVADTDQARVLFLDMAQCWLCMADEANLLETRAAAANRPPKPGIALPGGG